jgi:hypothetical protein
MVRARAGWCGRRLRLFVHGRNAENTLACRRALVNLRETSCRVGYSTTTSQRRRFAGRCAGNGENWGGPLGRLSSTLRASGQRGVRRTDPCRWPRTRFSQKTRRKPWLTLANRSTWFTFNCFQRETLFDARPVVHLTEFSKRKPHPNLTSSSVLPHRPQAIFGAKRTNVMRTPSQSRRLFSLRCKECRRVAGPTSPFDQPAASASIGLAAQTK